MDSPVLVDRSPTPKPAGNAARPANFLALLAAVIVLDFLVLVPRPGFGIAAAYFLAIAVIQAQLGKARSRRKNIAVAVFAGICCAPLFEAVTVFSLLTALAGVAILIVSARHEDLTDLVRWPIGATGVWLQAPFRLISDFLALARPDRTRVRFERVWRVLLAAILPLSFGLAFLILLSAANPLIENAMSSIRVIETLEQIDTARIFAWSIMAIAAWPVIAMRKEVSSSKPKVADPGIFARATSEAGILGRAPIFYALISFNALFAVQTLTDLIYLWGGAQLPDGMTFADYAHRGAYPLVVTALLAAAFVLIAMRKDGPGHRAEIRWLVYLFTVQNIGLVLSSILRLDLYVDAYLLTELRFVAFIWMGLVATGLILIIVKIVRGEDNRWLVGANLWALGAVFFGCSVVDIPAQIAQYNVENSIHAIENGPELDINHLAGIGAASIPAIDWLAANSTLELAEYWELRNLRSSLAAHAFGSLRTIDAIRFYLAPALPGPDMDIRSWNWRDYRLARYLKDNPGFPSRQPGAIKAD